MLRSASGMPDACPGDLLDVSSLRKACTGISRVFHCAGYAHAFSSSDPTLHWRINFEGTRNLLTAACDAGVRHFVLLSSVKAMAEPGEECVNEDWPGDPTTPYGRAKRAAEDLALELGARHGLHVVNLRLAMVYGRGGRGNLERMARAIRSGWFPRLPETGNRRSLLHVDDAVAAIRFVADAPAANGRTYVVADPRPYSGREIYDGIREALGLPPPRWRVPEPVLRMAGAAGDLVGRGLHRPLPINSEVVSRLLDSACYSAERIERELGWRAKIPLAAGLREMLC
jgi:nucleoside-diphosphate-sugar epimerase